MTLAIVKKVITELLRDKRTVLMMFVAPIFILFLMNVMFSAETSVSVNLAANNLPTELVNGLKKVDGMEIKDVSSEEEAIRGMKEGKYDAYLNREQDGNYTLLHANTDSSKTKMTRQAINTVLATDGQKELISSITKKLSQLSIPKTTPQAKPALKIEAPKLPEISQSYRYGDKNTSFFAKMIPVLIGFITFFFVFLISGMALLKERTSGTLDRLLATPVKRSQIVFGYMISYGILALIQTTIIVIASVYLMKLEVVGNIYLLVLVSNVLALVALAFGILLSTLAKSEFQMMQFIPLVVLPQLFFSGIIPLDTMTSWVRSIGKILPLTYSGHAMSGIVLQGKGIMDIWSDIAVLLIILVILTFANIFGMKRYRRV